MAIDVAESHEVGFDRDVKRGDGSILFHNTPDALKHITIPHRTPDKEIIATRDMNLHLLLRNMTGLGTAIREVAERAAHTGNTLDVLEAGNGAPFKALYFQENLLRASGDYMVYGTGPHEKPEVRSSVIAQRDYVDMILTDQSLFAGDKNAEQNLITAFLNPMMGNPTHYLNIEAMKGPIKDAYEAKKEKGEINIRVGDPVEQLQQAFDEGKRYDLLFPDLPAVADRMNYLQAVQASLKEGGYAFVPITWWSPKGMNEGHGINEKVFLDDVVTEDGKTTPFEDYLAQHFPEAFQIGKYPGAKTLVIRGTKTPQQLPEFDAAVKEDSAITTDGVSLKWTVK